MINGQNEGPLGRFHLALIQVFGEPLTRRTTVHHRCEKWSSPVLRKKSVGAGQKCGYICPKIHWTNQWMMQKTVIHTPRHFSLCPDIKKTSVFLVNLWGDPKIKFKSMVKHDASKEKLNHYSDSSYLLPQYSFSSFFPWHCTLTISQNHISNRLTDFL